MHERSPIILSDYSKFETDATLDYRQSWLRLGVRNRVRVRIRARIVLRLKVVLRFVLRVVLIIGYGLKRTAWAC